MPSALLILRWLTGGVGEALFVPVVTLHGIFFTAMILYIGNPLGNFVLCPLPYTVDLVGVRKKVEPASSICFWMKTTYPVSGQLCMDSHPYSSEPPFNANISEPAFISSIPCAIRESYKESPGVYHSVNPFTTPSYGSSGDTVMTYQCNSFRGRDDIDRPQWQRGS